MSPLFIALLIGFADPPQVPAEPPDDPKAWTYVKSCWVYLPREFEKDVPRAQLEKDVTAAIDHVATLLGAWPADAHLVVRNAVQDDDKLFRRGIVRTTWKDQERYVLTQHTDWRGWTVTQQQRIVERTTTVHAYVMKREIKTDLLRHELAHARIAFRGVPIPGWLNEGIAHYAENDDGFHPEYAALLKKGEIPTEAELAVLPKGSDKDLLLRAAAWAQVYHLRKLNWSMEEILRVQSPYALKPCVDAVVAELDRRTVRTVAK